MENILFEIGYVLGGFVLAVISAIVFHLILEWLEGKI